MYKRGAEWVRADFNLHTRADKEFSYSGEDDRFASDYVEKLEEENINLGVITNYNKFDLFEYHALNRKANKKRYKTFTRSRIVHLKTKRG